MEKYRVGVIGGTGMVGQRFVTLLENHPWFQLTAIAASSRSAGKTYEEAIGGRWALDVPMPGEAKDMVVLNAETDIDRIAAQVDFVFSAVDMKKEEIQALEEAYARRGCPVVSNNSAHRWTPDVPMVVPEINPEHLRVIEAQRRRLGTERGFIAVKSNCSLQSYVPALHPLPVSPRSRLQRPHGSRFRPVPEQALSGRNQSRLGGLPGPCPGAGPALCPQAVPALL